MSRREIIAGLGSAAAWPVMARAQQGDRVRRIGVQMNGTKTIPRQSAISPAFMQGLAELGWTDGRNMRINVRWAVGNVDRARMFAKGLVDLQPDVILATTTPVTAALQRETRTIPIVFALVADPVGEGFVAGLPRPGGNITGFKSQEDVMAGKMLGLPESAGAGLGRHQLGPLLLHDAVPWRRARRRSRGLPGQRLQQGGSGRPLRHCQADAVSASASDRAGAWRRLNDGVRRTTLHAALLIHRALLSDRQDADATAAGALTASAANSAGHSHPQPRHRGLHG